MQSNYTHHPISTKPMKSKSIISPSAPERIETPDPGAIKYKHSSERIIDQLLHWYQQYKRSLPWRSAQLRNNPYAIWLSEVLCQQTSVASALPYFEEIFIRWPTVEALSMASREAVLARWSGLGYYSRARNLHACARQVVEEYSGNFPPLAKDLERLPGIGAYTAAAIASIVSGEPLIAIDGNVKRVLSRLFYLDCESRHIAALIRKEIEPIWSSLETFQASPGDVNQAFMDLGARICRPRSANCALCPLAQDCLASKRDQVHELPRLARRPIRKLRSGIVFWITKSDNPGTELMMTTLPENGLLGGMFFLPTVGWMGSTQLEPEKADPLIDRFSSTDRGGNVDHVFSHFDLRLHILCLLTHNTCSLKALSDVRKLIPYPLLADCPRWTAQSDISSLPVPALLSKVIRTASEVPLTSYILC